MFFEQNKIIYTFKLLHALLTLTYQCIVVILSSPLEFPVIPRVGCIRITIFYTFTDRYIQCTVVALSSVRQTDKMRSEFHLFLPSYIIIYIYIILIGPLKSETVSPSSRVNRTTLTIVFIHRYIYTRMYLYTPGIEQYNR